MTAINIAMMLAIRSELAMCLAVLSISMMIAAPGIAAPIYSADDGILFPGKMFIYLGESVSFSGTLTGEGIAYPNNMYSVGCALRRKECLVTYVEQIGENQVGRVEIPYVIPITRWDLDEIIAEEEPSSASCSKTTIILQRMAEKVIWVQEPINQAIMLCDRSDHMAHRWTIEDSPGEKRLKAR